MIKFFRNIRKKLLGEGKTTKYFKYAIGEIVLVVIGILIALQINNWNESRKLNTSQVAYLDNLKKEILQNDIELNIKINQHKSILDNLTILSSLMKPNPAPIAKNKLDSLMFYTAYMPTFQPIKTFSGSENLKTIDNTELKKLIAKWNFTLENYIIRTKIIYDLYYNAIYPFIQEKYQMKNIKSDLFIIKESSFPINADGILSSHVFENHILMKILNTQGIYKDVLDLSSLHREITKIIDEIILKKL